jgi:hypothetical protein
MSRALRLVAVVLYVAACGAVAVPIQKYLGTGWWIASIVADFAGGVLVGTWARGPVTK